MLPFEKPPNGGLATLIFGTAVQALPGLYMRQPAALARIRQPSGAAIASTRVMTSLSGGLMVLVLAAPSPLSLSAIRVMLAPSRVEKTNTGFLPASCCAFCVAVRSHVVVIGL